MLPLILLTILTAQLPVCAQAASHEAVESLLTELRSLVIEGKFTRAALQIPESIRLAKLPGIDARDAAQLWNQAGLIHVSLGMSDLAEGEFRTGLQVLAGRSASVVEALLLYNLAELYLEVGGRPREAEMLSMRGLEVAEKLDGVQSPSRLAFLVALAGVKMQLGDQVAARKLFSEVLEWGGGQSPVARLHRAVALSGLGTIAQEEHNFPQAIRLFLDSIAVFEGVYGIRHPDTIPLYLNLASAYGRLHQWNRAEEVASLALEIAKFHLGSNGPLLARVLRAAAAAKRHTGKRAEAKKLEARARSLTGNSDSAAIRARVHVADLRSAPK